MAAIEVTKQKCKKLEYDIAEVTLEILELEITKDFLRAELSEQKRKLEDLHITQLEANVETRTNTSIVTEAETSTNSSSVDSTHTATNKEKAESSTESTAEASNTKLETQV